MKLVKKLLKQIAKDERGYGMAELMLIIALLGSIGLGVHTVLKGKMETSAGSVGDQIDGLISDWGSTES